MLTVGASNATIRKTSDGGGALTHTSNGSHPIDLQMLTLIASNSPGFPIAVLFHPHKYLLYCQCTICPASYGNHVLRVNSQFSCNRCGLCHRCYMLCFLSTVVDIQRFQSAWSSVQLVALRWDIVVVISRFRLTLKSCRKSTRFTSLRRRRSESYPLLCPHSRR
jgi:hypothetical protein